MPLCLLAPLPSEHVADALAVSDKSGVVALGTGDMSKENGGVFMFEFFKRLEDEGMMGTLPVFIQVSLSGRKPPAEYFVGQKASITGTLVSYEPADNLGRHKHPDERPASALKTDTALSGFWRVEGLKLLPSNEYIELMKFRSARTISQTVKPGPKIDFIVRGPILAFAP